MTHEQAIKGIELSSRIKAIENVKNSDNIISNIKFLETVDGSMQLLNNISYELDAAINKEIKRLEKKLEEL